MVPLGFEHIWEKDERQNKDTMTTRKPFFTKLAWFFADVIVGYSCFMVLGFVIIFSRILPISQSFDIQLYMSL